MRKCVDVRGGEVYIGKLYDDGSYTFFLRLYSDENGIFQMQWLRNSDEACEFLAGCNEVYDLLIGGLVGVKAEEIGDELVGKGYVLISQICMDLS